MKKKPDESLKEAEGKMTDKPLHWPTYAQYDRNKTAEDAIEIAKNLRVILERSNDAEVIRMAGRSLDKTNTILRRMESQGAPTRPD